MEMHHVRYFLALCDEENFTRAAQRCGVAQPSLSRAIQLLEEELGAPLFERGRPRSQLSAFGEIVRLHFAEIDRRVQEVREVAGVCRSRRAKRSPA